MGDLNSQNNDVDAEEWLLRHRLSDYSQWNRTVFAASVAAIFISAIAPQLATNDHAQVARPLLIVVWTLFAVTTIFSLLSSVATRRAARVSTPSDQEVSSDEPPTNTAAVLNLMLGLITTATFLAAIICFVVFMSINVAKDVDQRSGADLEATDTNLDTDR